MQSLWPAALPLAQCPPLWKRRPLLQAGLRSRPPWGTADHRTGLLPCRKAVLRRRALRLRPPWYRFRRRNFRLGSCLGARLFVGAGHHLFVLSLGLRFFRLDFFLGVLGTSLDGARGSVRQGQASLDCRADLLFRLGFRGFGFGGSPSGGAASSARGGSSAQTVSSRSGFGVSGLGVSSFDYCRCALWFLW